MARRKKKPKLVHEVYVILKSMLDAGEGTSRHEAKKNGTDIDKIFSFNTFKTYRREATNFVKWCQKNYRCKTLDECKSHIKEYLQRENFSAWTVHTRASAICKIYRMRTQDLGIQLPERKRADIKRSRNDAVRDKRISDETRKIFGSFVACTGCRRRELAALRGDCLIKVSGVWCVKITNGKGGKERTAPIYGTPDEIADVVKKMQDAGHNKVFVSIPDALDIHSYRAEYATRLYHKAARDLDSIPRTEKYFCRKDLKGRVYDKQAMKFVSLCMGHNRIDVIAQNYLRY